MDDTAHRSFTAALYEKRGAIAWITLNRPERLNAYNMAMRDDLFEILLALHADQEVSAVVLTGAGRAFSTGGDVSEFGLAPSPIVARWVRFRRDVWGLLRALPMPTLAAMHGLAVGGGLEMALLCDLAIAADDTRICLPETALGMIPGVCGTQTLTRRARLGLSLDFCLTGRWIDAWEAERIGLVVEIVPRARLTARAAQLAGQLARKPRLALAAAKVALWEGLDLPLSAALELERRLAACLPSFKLAQHTPDALTSSGAGVHRKGLGQQAIQGVKSSRGRD
jgi:enoyl-CoA hydratase/carnithine racemase